MNVFTNEGNRVKLPRDPEHRPALETNLAVSAKTPDISATSHIFLR